MLRRHELTDRSRAEIAPLLPASGRPGGRRAEHRPPISLAVSQPACVAYDVAANVTAHAAMVRAAGSRVVVFPELSLTGYHLDASPIAVDDPRLAPLIDACADAGAVALAGAPVRDEDGTVHIAMLSTTEAGAIVAYSKMWLGGAEAVRFAPGSTPAAIEVDGWRLGLAICKDTGVRQHASATAALGIDAYVAGVVESASDKDVIVERARRISVEHGVWVAVASFAGSTGGGYEHTAGRSAIWAPGGRRVAQVGCEAGEMTHAVLTPTLQPPTTPPQRTGP